jgi:hypothetical protein
VFRRGDVGVEADDELHVRLGPAEGLDHLLRWALGAHTDRAAGSRSRGIYHFAQFSKNSRRSPTISMTR